MLVLSRKKNESLLIGINGEIEIVVVEVRGDKVRIGVQAPKEVPVHRREVYEAIQRQESRELLAKEVTQQSPNCNLAT